jgi:MscS family membrane protein
VNVGAVIAGAWADGTESKLDDQLIPMMRQAAQILVLVLGTIYIADEVGFDVWKLAAGVGIGGLAFALAAQDTVANLFGSVNIFVDRPFQIGDWVKIGKVEGVVEEVGFRSTRVRTFYNSLVTIPNSSITNANVDNLGLRTRRRTKFVLGVTYNTPPDKLAAFVEGIRAILAMHPSVQRTYEVHLYNLGTSGIEILVYYHLIVPGWHEELCARSQNILEFMRLADDLGISFAFPSTSVYVESTPERPQAPHSAQSLVELEALSNAYGPDGTRARPLGPQFNKSWSVQARGEYDNRGSADDDG